jgi:RHS repeat-associated protein
MGRVTTYDYHPNNNWLTSRTYPNANENVSFTYTSTGRRLTATDARGTTDYGYDLRDRLTSLTQPGAGQLAYAYDGNGNRTSLIATVAGTGHATTYEYDDASRLDLVKDPQNRVYDHGYDANGNRTSLQFPNGTTTAYVYNSLNRLTNLGVTGPSGTVFSQAFTLGAAGNRTQIVENDGTTKDYNYDSLYRLTRDKVSDTVGLIYQKDFVYDAVGNRQQQTTVGTGLPGTPTASGTIDYTYDTRDRMLTENANSLTYDTNGNLTAKVGEATYTWDHESRLKKVEKSGGTVVEYLYDADGNRVQTKTTPSGGSATTVNYLTDTSGGLSHVVAEVDVTATPTLQALYVRGIDDLLSVMRPAGGGGWTSKFFHADGIGSIRRLTNESGTITDGYSYTAFGERIAHTGTDPQPYSFAGEPLDPNSGFQYHRARWMDPRAGRFTGMDPFAGVEFEPGTLHKYLYGSAAPQDRRDPTGRFSLAEGLVVAAVVGIIASIALGTSPFLGRVPQNMSTEVLVTNFETSLIPGFGGWTDEAALAAFHEAQAIWAGAGIFFVASAFKRIPGIDLVKAVPCDDAKYLAALPYIEHFSNAKHVTVLVPNAGVCGLSAADGVASRGRLPGKDRAFAFISSSGRVIAHEWGHTLKLPHYEGWGWFNLMTSGGFGRSLTDDQVFAARAYARTY